MNIVKKVFINKRTGQGSLVLPKKQLLNALKVNKIPEYVNIKITKLKIPKQI